MSRKPIPFARCWGETALGVPAGVPGPVKGLGAGFMGRWEGRRTAGTGECAGGPGRGKGRASHRTTATKFSQGTVARE